MIPDNIKKEASELVSRIKKPTNVEMELTQNDKLGSIRPQSLESNSKETEQGALKEPQDKTLVGTGEYNAESRTWEADVTQNLPLSAFTTDPDESFKQFNPDIERDDQKDWQIRWDKAYEAEIERRKLQYSKEESQYMLAKEYVYTNSEGEIEKEIILGKLRYNSLTGELEEKLNEFGYDSLPPDIQEMMGRKEDVVGHWRTATEEYIEINDAYTDYAYKDDKGYDSWEAYKLGEGFGKQEEITIEPAQDFDDNENDKPLETPTVEQGETPTPTLNK